MKKILTSFVSNTVFANVALVMIFIAGVFAAMNMVKENFPEFSLDMITVSINYPGADPEEIEEGITRKLEESIDSVGGIKQYNTLSKEGICLTNIEVKPGYKVDKVLEDIRTKINSISTFPVDAEKPIIKELILEDPVALLFISGDASEKTIKNLSSQIKDEIQNLSDVSQIKLFGDREYEICVEVSKKNLEQYGISLLDIANAIRDNNLNLAAGKIRSQKEEIGVRTIGRKYTAEELASILVITTHAGGSVPLYRLAEIRDTFKEDSVEANINGELAMILIIYKTKEEDALAISEAINKYVSAKQKILPGEINLDILYDNTDMLRSRIKLLLKNGFLGFLIVFTSLWVFLNFRLSFWASMGMLVSIFGALVIVYFIGGTINMVSLFGLIMVLGIVVDDAIIIGEAIHFHRKKGESAFDAAINGVCEVGLPVLTAVTTTIVAFMPLFYVGGIMGKFISILPAIVIACLIVSLGESLFLLPAHLTHLPKISNGCETQKSNFLKISKLKNLISEKMKWFINSIYTPFLVKALAWRYVSFSIVIAFLLVTVGLFRGGLLKFEVFPAIDGFIMTSTVEFPDGTPLMVTKNAIKKIEDALISLSNKTDTLSGDSLIKSRLSLIGETLEAMPRHGSYLGSVQAILLESEKRGIHSDNLMVLWEKEIGDIAGIRSLKFEGLSAGPPGAPIEIWIQGHNIEVLSEVANELMFYLRKFDGVYQVCSDFLPGKNEFHVQLKPNARYLDLTLKDIAQQINAAYYGAEVLKIQRGRDNVKIKVSYKSDERNNTSSLDKMNIRTNDGYYVPLTSVANISFKPGYSSITRTNGMRRISVSAGVDTSISNSNEIFIELSSKYFPKLLEKYPDILISPQGEQKKMKESLGSLLIGFPIAIFCIFMIVATTFRSYLQPVIIMFTIPFGIIGAAIGHMLLGFNMSIMSIFGMVALTGVVVNDSVVLIERINVNLALGMSFFDSITSAASRRFMAIFLTTISTVGGLAPIILETDIQARFLIPMAISIAFGVAFASILTLILVPSFFAILSDIRVIFNKIKYGESKKRELLEPAYNRIISDIN